MSSWIDVFYIVLQSLANETEKGTDVACFHYGNGQKTVQANRLFPAKIASESSRAPDKQNCSTLLKKNVNFLWVYI